MRLKDDLHELVERPGDERAVEARADPRWLLSREEDAGQGASPGDRRMSPPIVSGQAFFSQRSPVDLPALAARQWVEPVENFDDLLGDFWPQDESIDEFIATVRHWRRAGGHA